jgi:Flp pilus assembly protein TadG
LTRTIALRWLIRLTREERGSDLVEFAVTSLVLVSVVLGMVEFGLAMYAYHFVSSAAQLGARYAIVRGADFTSSCSTSAPPNFTLNYHCNASSSDVQNYVQSLAIAGLNPASVSATTTWPAATPDCTSGCSACSTSSKNAGCLVKVQVSYSFGLPLHLFSQSSLSLTSTAEEVIQE